MSYPARAEGLVNMIRREKGKKGKIAAITTGLKSRKADVHSDRQCSRYPAVRNPKSQEARKPWWPKWHQIARWLKRCSCRCCYHLFFVKTKTPGDCLLIPAENERPQSEEWGRRPNWKLLTQQNKIDWSNSTAKRIISRGTSKNKYESHRDCQSQEYSPWCRPATRQRG